MIDGVGTEPAQAVAVFLDSLRRGDETAANGVLTTHAREELQKTAYQIQPLGTPDGKYEIGRVLFPYEEKNVAVVECQWTEPPMDNQPGLVMEIVCEVHLETEGWRISGLGVKMAGTEDILVLDFEDAAALQETLDGTASTSKTASANAQPTTNQQPQNVPAQLTSQTQFNAQPQFGTTNELRAPSQFPAPTQDPNTPAQLAFPPLNNAPVQR